MASKVTLNIPKQESPFRSSLDRLEYRPELTFDLSQSIVKISEIAKLRYTTNLDTKERSGVVVWHETLSVDLLRNLLSDSIQTGVGVMEVGDLLDFALEEFFDQEDKALSLRIHLYLKAETIRLLSRKNRLFETIEDASSFVKFTQESKFSSEGTIVRDVLDRVFHLVPDNDQLTRDEMQEVIAFYPLFNHEKRKSLLMKFSRALKDDMQSENAVEGFIELFRHELKLYTTYLVDQTISNKGERKLFLIDPSELVTLALSITIKLKAALNQQSDETLIERNLNALAMISKALIIVGAQPILEESSISLQSILVQYASHRSLTIASLARYSESAFAVIGISKSNTQQALEVGSHFVEGVLHVINAAKGGDGISLINAVKAFSKAFTIPKTAEPWLLPLVVLDDLVLRSEKGEYLSDLQRILNGNTLKDLIGKSSSNSEFYVSGVVSLCREVFLKFRDQTEAAIKVLDTIVQNNRVNARKCDLTISNKNWQEQILHEIFNIHYRLTFHPVQSIRATARSSLGDVEIAIKERRNLYPKLITQLDFLPLNSFNSRLFNNGLTSDRDLKWQPALRDWRNKFLVQRSENERNFYYPLRVKQSVEKGDELSIFDSLKKFLTSDKKVLLILGDAGSGKTISMINYVVGVWNQEAEYDSNGFVPIFIPLGKAEKPFDRVFNEFIPSETIDFLRRRKMLGIFDGFDEGHAKVSSYNLPNLLVRNNLSSWEQSKWVITWRSDKGMLEKLKSGSLDLEHFNLNGEGPEVVVVQPVVRKNFIELSLPKIARGGSIRNGNGSVLEAWTPEKYIKFLDELDKKLTSQRRNEEEDDRSYFLRNPFFLTVLIRYLPSLQAKSSTERINISEFTILTEVIKSNIDRYREKRIILPRLRIYFISLVIADLMKGDDRTILPDPRLEGDDNRNALERINQRMQRGWEFLWEKNTELLSKEVVGEAISCIQVERDFDGNNLVYKSPIYADYFNSLVDDPAMALTVASKIDSSFKGIKRTGSSSKGSLLSSK